MGKYSVKSTITYKPRVTRTVAASDVWADCRITSRTITSDRTEWNEWFDGEFYYAGQVTVRYTGTCTDSVWVGDSLKAFTWNSAWSDDDYIMTDDLRPGDDVTAAKYAELQDVVGDADVVAGQDMEVLPRYSTFGGSKTIKKTRTVVVR